MHLAPLLARQTALYNCEQISTRRKGALDSDNVTGMGKVANHLVGAFVEAQIAAPDLHRKWTNLGWKAGPHSRGFSPVPDFKFLGELDLVLREMERDLVSERSPSALDLRPDLLRSLSGAWIGLAYSTHYLVRQDERLPAVMESTYDDLRLLRVQLEKHEYSAQGIKKPDRRPMTMAEFGPEGPGERSIYDPDDPDRQFSPVLGISYRGSMVWNVGDLRNRSSKWVERQSLSDQILSGWLGDD